VIRRREALELFVAGVIVGIGGTLFVIYAY
jgi:hypothetical protein